LEKLKGEINFRGRPLCCKNRTFLPIQESNFEIFPYSLDIIKSVIISKITNYIKKERILIEK